MKNTQLEGKQKGQIINNNLEQKVKSTYEKATHQLEDGKSIITMAGGTEYPIMFKEVLAGEYLESWNVDNITRLLTPLVPTLDKIFITIKAFFVPHTRIWKSAERLIAAKYDTGTGNNGDGVLDSIPNWTVPKLNTQLTPFRQMLASRYGLPNHSGDTQINVLLLRGYRAITNDYLINKEYEARKIEWNDDSVVTAEQNAINGYNTTTGQPLSGAYMIEAAQTRKSYLTNIKKSMTDNDTNPDELGDHLDWQTLFMDIKQRVDNANKNDWDIIAEMGGTKPVKTDRVEFIGEIDYELNYQQITQSAPEIDNSSPLGTTGSFSYTRASGNLISHKQFLQHGFIHVLASINIERAYEEGTPKELLKTNISEIYRPTKAKKEIQLLKSAEVVNADAVAINETVAFQPAWAEYKRMPKLVTGDARTILLTKISGETSNPVTVSQWHNLPSRTSKVTIDGSYFRPSGDTNNVVERNNILKYAGGFSHPNPFINMSAHKVKTSLPMENSTFDSESKAEQTR